MVYNDDTWYMGEWFDSKADGYGEICNREDIQYLGNWVMDTRSGEGEEIFPNGSKFVGSFLDGKSLIFPL